MHRAVTVGAEVFQVVIGADPLVIGVVVISVFNYLPIIVSFSSGLPAAGHGIQALIRKLLDGGYFLLLVFRGDVP